MARNKKHRFIQMAPHFSGFKPQGIQNKKDKIVIILFEEYEAIKLCDYELLNQTEAAELMNVSRPTYTRIYESARRKIAQAFIEGAHIRFEGGNVTLVNWYSCSNCNINFTLIDPNKHSCPLCNKYEIIPTN